MAIHHYIHCSVKRGARSWGSTGACQLEDALEKHLRRRNSGRYGSGFSFADLPILKQRVADVLKSAGGHPGHIFNLGHGVMPDMNPDHVKAVVEYVRGLGAENGRNSG
ncbi:MAG: uroporphyrinogen decarboxylase family protein [Planctomycetaceae bacterium]